MRPSPQDFVGLAHAMGFGPKEDRVLKMYEVVEMTGLSRRSIHRLVEAGTFPVQVAVDPVNTPTTMGWRRSEVLQWMASRPNSYELPA